jgi:signal transduction histidine kinase
VTSNAERQLVDVLLVDDDEEDYLLTKDVFGEIEGTRYALHWVGEYRLALEALQERDYDVCLVDYRLGAENGIQLIRELVAAGHDLPVIVMTGQGDRDVDVEAAQSGAADYLIKGEVTPTLLERTLRYAMRRRADLRALRESEADLRQAQRMEAVGQLAGGIAHDFNNMMTAVIGFSDLVLARLESGDPVRHDIEEIKRAGQRAAAMTNQLLAFSRRQVLKPRVFDLNTVVADVEKLLQRLIGEDIELVSVLDPALQPIEADPGQLEQVIMNLAVNARDAMPAGGRLTIETRNCELGPEETDRHLDLAPGRYVMLRVTDTGAGIDTETMRRVFEPFFTTKEEGKGTGLGLATVLGIIKQSGGDIEVDSEIDQGTAFRIYLPQAEMPIDLVGPIVSTNRAPAGRNMTLITEDKELVRYAQAESP